MNKSQQNTINSSAPDCALLVKGIVRIPNLIFETRRQFYPDRSGFSEYPGIAANRVETFAMETDHRDDWQVRLEYVTGKPVSLTLLQDGQVVSKSDVSSCDKPR